MEAAAVRRIVAASVAGRLVLAVFAVAETVVGAWALLAPRSFYERFPGFGWHWVRAAGAYDEHLVRDFGGAIAGLAMVALVCAARPSRALLLAMVTGWEVESVPHLVFHLFHQDVLPAGQDALNLVVLSLVVVVPLLATALLWRGSVASPTGVAMPGTLGSA
ncbi:MAG TPA: hypothetical protein VE991_12930 [Acidimicrobiales bacterium]|nr:hypothetical protein [Acidimicrobiales bacterium]